MGGSTQSQLGLRVENMASQQADQLSALGLGQMEAVMSALRGKFGGDWGKIPGEVKAGYDKVRASTEREFTNAATSSAEANRYLARTQGGGLVSGGEVNEANLAQAQALDQRRRLTIGQINTDEANAAMSANNGFMRLMTGAGSTALGLAQTYSNQALQGAGMASQANPWQSAMGGAASGASLGSVAGPWGALIGGVVGGAGGYLAGR